MAPRGLYHALCVPVCTTALPLGHIVARRQYVPAFWKYVSWLFPSTFGMNGYVRITGTGACLADIAFEYRGLWLQALVYFLLACLMYHLEIRRMVVRVRA